MNRYSRQIMLPEIGESGQRKLHNARVLVVGAGGLGSPVALYLAAAGVGTIGIADCDTVNITNLNRQVLYNEGDIGVPKTERAAEKLRQLNSGINVVAYNEFITEKNAQLIISQYDIVIDACDNAATRYLISDITSELGKPYVYGAISGFEGQVSVFNLPHCEKADGATPKTYRDLWPNEQEMLQIEPYKGVVGVTAGVVGTLQANEAIKIICGSGEILAGKLLLIDLCGMKISIVELP